MSVDTVVRIIQDGILAAMLIIPLLILWPIRRGGAPQTRRKYLKAEKRLKQQEQGRAGFEVELKVLNTEVLYCKVEKARTLETSRDKDETTDCEKETQ
jgi:hypothetical protein